MSDKLKVLAKRLHPDAVIPEFKSSGAAGGDVCSTIDVTIMPGQSAKIPLGIALQAPEGYMFEAVGRSGLGCKFGLRLANCVGIIDNDYRGEIMVVLINDGDLQYTIRKGDAVAQLLLREYHQYDVEVVDELSDTIRGEGGFGSTGK